MVFYIEHLIDGEWREDSYEVFDVETEPLVRGRYSGPPENCYPDEGGYACGGAVLWKQKCEGKGENIPWEEFVQRYAADKKIKMEDAEEEINCELYDEAVDDARAAREGAMEDRFERDRDDRMLAD